MLIYERITSVRKQHDLTLEDFAAKTGISLNTIKKWGLTTDPTNPTLGHLQAICKCFDVSLDYLAGNTDDPHSHKSGKIREIGAFEKIRDYAQQEIMRIQEK